MTLRFRSPNPRTKRAGSSLTPARRAVAVLVAVAWAAYSSNTAIADTVGRGGPADAPQPSAAVQASAALVPQGDMLAGLPPYLPKAPVKGQLVVAGSTAMNQLALLWADGLKHVHPEAQVEVRMFESGQVLSRLAKGEMQVGLISRPLTEKEIKENGVIALPAAKDVLGVVVNPDNPIERLTVEQGIQILRDPAAADKPGARTWGQLGLQGDWAKLPLTVYGRSAGSGAWGYLVDRFLGGEGARKQTECNSYAEVCNNVAKDRGGVGYVSLCLAPPTVGKVVALTLTTTGETIPAPRQGQQVDPRYPLVRDLYVVVKHKEGEPLSPVAQELLRYVLSRSGQEDAVKAGLIPLRRDEVLACRDQLGWRGAR